MAQVADLLRAICAPMDGDECMTGTGWPETEEEE